MAAGDTFRAAASDQLEVWAERTGSEIVMAEGENASAKSGTLTESCINNCAMFSFKSNSYLCLVISQAVKRGKDEKYDVVLCDTSGRMLLHLCFYLPLLYLNSLRFFFMKINFVLFYPSHRKV